jgi:hypothetical protein
MPWVALRSQERILQVRSGAGLAAPACKILVADGISRVSPPRCILHSPQSAQIRALRKCWNPVMAVQAKIRDGMVERDSRFRRE